MGHPRFVTVVLPSVVNEVGAPYRLKAIHETWGPTANSVYVINNDHFEDLPVGGNPTQITEKSAPQDSYVYPQILPLPSDLKENNVPRLRYIIQRIHESLDPEIAFFVNDHSFVIPEHLCQYVAGLDHSADLYAGHALQTDELVFNSGAAGYFLSRSTMEKLVHTWKEAKDPTCVYIPNQSTQHMKFLQKRPGLYLTACLKSALGITAIDTREDGKYHRFHALPLTKLILGKVDEWYIAKHTVEAAKIIGTDESYATLLLEEDCCAKTTVTFHYVEALECKALFWTRQKLLEDPSLSDAALRQVMTSVWPVEGKDLGGYSRRLPRDDNEEGWKSVLQVVRRISLQETQGTC
jgi:hypothetical protein